MWLTRTALAHPIAVAMFSIAVGIVGWSAAAGMGRSVLPPVAFPVISITARYPGAGPTEIERLIVEPIEDALDSVPNVERVSASAQNSLAQISVRLRFGTPLQAAQSDVQHAVDAARANLPADLLPPLVVRDDPSQIPIAAYAVSSVVLGEGERNRIVDRSILPALRETSGVGTVRVSGERSREFVVTPRREALDALHASDLDVFRALQSSYAVYGGGTQTRGGTQTTVGIRSPAESAQALSDIPISIGTDASVRTGAIASVRDTFEVPTTIARFDGNDAVLLYIARAQDADSTATIDRVRATVARLVRDNPLVRIEEYHSDRPFTQAAIGGVEQTLLEGVVLTALVMLLFLRSWRSAAVATLAIPLSILATFIAARALGFTLNVLSLMGLSMTIGILVDDSIVIIEAISRARDRGLAPDEAAVAGRSELGGAAIAITLVDVVVFVPIALMSGVVGEFMREFASVIAIATSFSLLVSFTLTPLLCARWALLQRARGVLPWTLRTRVTGAAFGAIRDVVARASAFETSLCERYVDRWLPAAARHRNVIIGTTVVACVASFVPVATAYIPSEFSPPSNRGEVVVELRYPAGTPLSTTDAGARRFGARLLDDDRVSDVATIAGTGFTGGSSVVASNIARISIELSDPSSVGNDVARFAKSLRASVPGASIVENGRGMGGGAPIAFTIGGDPSRLAQGAANLVALLEGDPLADDVMRSDAGTAPHLDLRVDDRRAQLLGASAADVAQSLRIATGGSLATRVRTDDGTVDVLERSDERANVRTNSGILVPTSALMLARPSNEPLVIQRENRERIISVSANPRDGVAVGAAMAPIRGKIAAVLPPGSFIEQRGDLEQFLNAVTNIFEALGMSVLLVYAILAILYRSYTLPLVIMTTVPLAAIGAFGALALLNALHRALPDIDAFNSQTLNLYSMLGVVMLVGLVAKNGILLVEYAERELRKGVAAFEAMQSAARRRFRPIVMTTMAMVFGMLPLALGHAAGAEYRKALGSVVIGGLLTSLVLTLVVVPLAYTIAKKRERARAVSRSSSFDKLRMTH